MGDAPQQCNSSSVSPIRRGNFLKHFLRIFSIGIAVVALFLAVNWPSASPLAEKIGTLDFRKRAVAALISGNWDFVCAISETVRPVDVLKEIQGNSYSEVESPGADNRRILLDGESGLLAVSTKDRNYALYLVFDENRMRVLMSGKNCVLFDDAELRRVERLSRDGWLYVELFGRNGQ